VSVIDDEDRIYAARSRESGGWPFDAPQDDPLTAHRIPVTSSHPRWYYLVSFDGESAERPTEREMAMLVSFLDEYKDHWYGDNSYRRAMEQRPFDVDGGANGVVFHKWGTDDWGYRRHSYERGYLFSVVPPALRDLYDDGVRGPLSLLALMDRIHTMVDEPMPRWVAWKVAHPDVFGGES
jgi:hypothetical protein